MKVILLVDLPKKGRKHDVIEVADGYALNFLLPQKKAQIANKSNLNLLKQAKATAAAKTAALLEDVQKIKTLVEAQVYQFKVQTHKNKVFGSISPKQIVSQIETLTKKHFDAKQIKITKPLNTLGSHQVILQLEQKQQAKLVVQVIAEVNDSN